MPKLRIVLSDDEYLVDAIKGSIKNNGGYCPCAIKKTEDMKCICKNFREMQEPGTCQCGLYVKVFD